MDEQTSPDPVGALTVVAEIVSAYVSNNAVRPADLPNLIALVQSTLEDLRADAAPAERATPAAIRRSITPDALISFVDGKRYKALRRHLTRHGLDPATYRTRYGLPSDYPMVAAAYSAARSKLAKDLGLGQFGRGALAAAAPTATASDEAPAKKGGGKRTGA